MIDVKLTCEPFFGSNFYWLVFFVTGDDRWGENFPRSINGGRPVAKKKKKKVAKKKKKVTKKKKKVAKKKKKKKATKKKAKRKK